MSRSRWLALGDGLAGHRGARYSSAGAGAQGDGLPLGDQLGLALTVSPAACSQITSVARAQLEVDLGRAAEGLLGGHQPQAYGLAPGQGHLGQAQPRRRGTARRRPGRLRVGPPSAPTSRRSSGLGSGQPRATSSGRKRDGG